VQTVYDWVTVAIFAGIIVLFLQRSVGPVRDSMWPYLVAAIACAVTNQIGNRAVEDADMVWHALAVVALVATLAFINHFLRPFGPHD
jgi:intracellular septation protein A